MGSFTECLKLSLRCQSPHAVVFEGFEGTSEVNSIMSLQQESISTK